MLTNDNDPIGARAKQLLNVVDEVLTTQRWCWTSTGQPTELQRYAIRATITLLDDYYRNATPPWTP